MDCLKGRSQYDDLSLYLYFSLSPILVLNPEIFFPKEKEEVERGRGGRTEEVENQMTFVD